MTTPANKIMLYKSKTVLNGISNGGPIWNTPIISGARFNIFPRVSKAQAVSGITLDRKVGLKTNDDDNISLYEVNAAIDIPSPAGDYYMIGSVGRVETQGQWVADPPVFVGCGQLHASLFGGESSIAVQMKSNVFEVVPNGYIKIANKVLTEQTVASLAKQGESVELISGTWQVIPRTNDTTHPKGWFMGGGKVFTNHSGTNEEFLRVRDSISEEVIGLGNDTNTPALDDFSFVVNGLLCKKGFYPIIEAISDGVTKVVTVGLDGTCSGYCSAGKININTGVWETPIIFNGAIDGDSEVKGIYYDKPYNYSGNVMTIQLSHVVANSYTVDTTYVSGCITQEEVSVEFSDFIIQSVNGLYNIESYPLVLNNKGCVEDTWTLAFTSATSFVCSGALKGNVGSGSVTANFAPVNILWDMPYFSLNKNGFSGSFVAGDKIVFKTHIAAMPLVIRQVVPSGTPPHNNNYLFLNFTWE